MSLLTENAMTVLVSDYVTIDNPVVTMLTVPSSGSAPSAILNYTPTLGQTTIIVVPVNTPRVVAVFSTVDNSGGNVGFRINADKTNANVGDELVLLLSFASDINQCVISLGPQFYFTSCGNFSYTLVGYYLYRAVNFVYNGSTYICTDNSC